MKILILSDLHIGSRQSDVSVNTIHALVQKLTPSLVILAGDTLDLLANDNLIIKVNNECLHKAILLRGNHDLSISQKESTEFSINGKKAIVFHGHQYATKSIFDAKFWVRVNEFFIKTFKVNFQNIGRRTLSKDYPEGEYLPDLYEQRSKILEEYKNKDFDIVISGHTHYPEVTKFENFTYVNVGNWEWACIIDSDGIKLHRISELLSNAFPKDGKGK